MKLDCCAECRYQRRDEECGISLEDGGEYPLNAACSADKKKARAVMGASFMHRLGTNVTIIGIAHDSAYHDKIAPGNAMLIYIEDGTRDMYYVPIDKFVGMHLNTNGSFVENFAYIDGGKK